MNKDYGRNLYEQARSYENAHGEIGVKTLADEFSKLIREGKVNLSNLRYSDVGYAIYGDRYRQFLNGNPSVLREAGEVRSSAFSTINTSIAIAGVMEGYQSAEKNFHQELEVEFTDKLDGGIRALVGRPQKVDDMEVEEGKPYIKQQFSGHTLNDPATKKVSLAIELTREALIQDQTGQMLERLRSVGEDIARYKEESALSLLAATSNFHQYTFDGTSFGTYGQSSDGLPWVNELPAVALQDFTDLNDAKSLFSSMTDPSNGDLLSIRPSHLVVPPALEETANAILTTTGIKRTYGANESESEPPRVVKGVKLIVSPRLRKVIADVEGTPSNADGQWFYGDIRKAFGMLQAYPFNVNEPFALEQASEQNSLMFLNDLVAIYKATWIGRAKVKDPRYIMWAYVATSRS